MNFHKLFFSIVLTACLTVAAFAQTDKRVAAIRALYDETNKKVTECEADGETSTTFLTELVVNKNNGSYPAVGIYRTIAKFYYTFGDREKNPYPDRLLKIETETKRSSNIEKSEYLFDEKGQLVFYFESKVEGEKRVYFNAGKAFRVQEGEKFIAQTDKRALELIRNAQTESRKLQTMFKTSLGF